MKAACARFDFKFITLDSSHCVGGAQPQITEKKKAEDAQKK